MPDQVTDTHLAPLPESLRKQLEKFKKDLWRIKITEAILAGLLGLIVSFALVFALDRVWEIPSFVRLIILITGVSLFTIFAPFWINRWVFKHRKENQLALLISKSYPNLGDRLLGVVELQNQEESQTALSPELREAAMIAVAHDAKGSSLDKALSATWRNKLALGAMLTAGLCSIAFFIFPSAGRNALKRWAMPLSDTKRFTFTKFDTSEIPNPLYVALDEPFSLSVPLTSDTEQFPDSAEARFGASNWDTFSLNGNQYDLKFKGQRANGNIYLKAGDANLELEVRPLRRPRLKLIQGLVSYPKYLEREDVKEEFIAGQIQVLEGSKIAIIAKAERDLRSAVVGPLVIDKYIDLENLEEAEIQGLDPNDAPKQVEKEITFKIDKDNVLPEPFIVTKDIFTLPISWTDNYGISGLNATKLNISSVEDTPPSTYVQEARKQIYMLHTEVLRFVMQAEDDYGIKAAGIDWNGTFNTPSASAPAKGEERFIVGDPYKQSAQEDIELDFKSRQIIPQKLDIRTWVEDYNPATPRMFSEVMEVFLLNESEHANYQKERMKDALAELEDAMRREQENLDENKRIEKELKNPKNDKSAQEAKKKLDDQQLKEQENQDEVKKLSKKMEDIFKESMKNKNITPKTLKDMSDAAQQMKEMADEDMPDIAKKLDDAQSEKNSEQKTKEDVKEAIKKQEKLLKKMKDTAKKAEDANKKLESSTFVNRLKQAASDEEQIASGLMPDDGILAADYYADLDPVRQRLFQALYLQQQQTTADVRWIQEDLGFFFSRTQKEIHKQVLEQMQESSISEELRKIENEIEAARVFIPMSKALGAAKQLREWAKLLDGKEDEGGSSGGGGGGGSNQEDEDFEFMLRVMKMIQTEQQLRARTRALEQSKRNAESNESQNPLPTESGETKSRQFQ